MNKTYDIIIVTPDAYVDHPSFAHALLKRNLEKAGYSVKILDRPKWQNKEYFLYGKPKLFWAISGGNVDSVVMNYTSMLKKRKTDDYQENGNPYFPDMPKGEKSRIRPDRCVTVYVNGIKSIDKETPIVIGGIEASLRRLAHYDFLSDRVRASILVDCGAGLLVYGMGEKTLQKIASELKKGKNIKDLDLRGTCKLLSKHENPDAIELPSFDEVRNNNKAFVKMTEVILENSNPYTANPLIQKHSGRRVIQYPPNFPLSEKDMDEIYNHDFAYSDNKSNIPALRMIGDSITIHRGCIGGCSFCSITLHQGKCIQSRSEKSIIDEVKKRAKKNNFNKVITDLGGPSADMYKLKCENVKCKRTSCLYPDICPVIKKQKLPAKSLYKRIFSLKNKTNKPLLKHLFIGSGIRHDLTLTDNEYMKFLINNCVSGYLKIAPEHVSDNVLQLMNKPKIKIFEKFITEFNKIIKQSGKKQFLIPYIIIGHPGETHEDIIILKKFLQKYKIKAEQIQIFTPTPMTISTCMYYTGIVPFTHEKIAVCKNRRELKERKESIVNSFKRKQRRS